MKNSFSNILRGLASRLCISALLLLPAQSAMAAAFTWTGTQSEFWGVDGNWNLDDFPEVGDTATINMATTVDLGGPQAVDQLIMGSGASLINSDSGGLTVGAGGGGTAIANAIVSLSGNGTSISAPVTFGTLASTGLFFGVSGTSGDSFTVSAPVNLGTQTASSSYLVFGDTSNTSHLHISGDISGSVGGSLRFNLREGSLTLSGNNTFTSGSNAVNFFGPGGTDTVATVNLASSSALGSTANTVTVPNGSTITTQNRVLQFLITEPGLTIGNNVETGQSAIVEIGGTNTTGTVTWSGTMSFLRRSVSGVPVTNPPPVRLTAAEGGTVLFSGQFMNPGAAGTDPTIEKVGLGTVIMSSPGGYGGNDGLVRVKAGTLLVTNLSGSATGGASMIVESGAIFGGTGGVSPSGSRVLTVESGGILLGGMGVAAEGTFSFGVIANANNGLIFESGSIIRLVLGPDFANSSLHRVNGIWTFDANQQFDFVLLSGADFGTYENIITGLASDPDVSSWTVTTSGFGGSTFTYDNGNVHLELIPEPSTAMLLATVFLGLFLIRKRRA